MGFWVKSAVAHVLSFPPAPGDASPCRPRPWEVGARNTAAQELSRALRPWALLGGSLSPPSPRGRCGRTRRTAGRPGRSLPRAAAPGDLKPGRRARGGREYAPVRSGPAMQSLELGLAPAPAREPRLTRWLRRGSGILAHLLALGFTIFLTVLSRPGTSEWAGRGGARGGAEGLEGLRVGAPVPEAGSRDPRGGMEG